MSKTKFTPGPWVIKPEEVGKSYIRIRGGALGGRFKIANVVKPEYEGARAREKEETRANAALIAAAPEMYKFLDDLANGRGTDYPIEQLLAKARGEL